MNAAHDDVTATTGVVGARAIRVTPVHGGRYNGLQAVAAGPHGVLAAWPSGSSRFDGMPKARTTVLDPDVESGLRDRWSRVRNAFADDPRTGMRDADALLQDVSAAFAEAIEEHRARLAVSWQVGRPGMDRLQETLRLYDGLVGALLGQS